MQSPSGPSFDFERKIHSRREKDEKIRRNNGFQERFKEKISVTNKDGSRTKVIGGQTYDTEYSSGIPHNSSNVSEISSTISSSSQRHNSGHSLSSAGSVKSISSRTRSAVGGFGQQLQNPPPTYDNNNNNRTHRSHLSAVESNSDDDDDDDDVVEGGSNFARRAGDTSDRPGRRRYSQQQQQQPDSSRYRPSYQQRGAEYDEQNHAMYDEDEDDEYDYYDDRGSNRQNPYQHGPYSRSPLQQEAGMQQQFGSSKHASNQMSRSTDDTAQIERKKVLLTAQELSMLVKDNSDVSFYVPTAYEKRHKSDFLHPSQEYQQPQSGSHSARVHRSPSEQVQQMQTRKNSAPGRNRQIESDRLFHLSNVQPAASTIPDEPSSNSGSFRSQQQQQQYYQQQQQYHQQRRQQQPQKQPEELAPSRGLAALNSPLSAGHSSSSSDVSSATSMLRHIHESRSKKKEVLMHNVQRKQAEQQPTDDKQDDVLFTSKKRREVDYRPYTLRDYKNINQAVNLGGLGPDLLNDELIERQKKVEKMREYAKAVSEYNNQKIAAELIASQNRPIASHRSPSPKKESARDRMLEFAKRVPRPKVNKQQQLQHPSSGSNMSGGYRGYGDGEGSDYEEGIEGEPRPMTELERLEMMHMQDKEWIRKEFNV